MTTHSMAGSPGGIRERTEFILSALMPVLQTVDG
jgi:hypothetical protein